MSVRIPINGNTALRQAVREVLESRVRPQDIDLFGMQDSLPRPHEVVRGEDASLVLVHRVDNTDPLEGGGLKDEFIHLTVAEQNKIRPAIP